MLEVNNLTPFPARIAPWVDAAGATHAVVVAKATFALAGGRLALADEQVAVRLADEHHGAPPRTSVRYESDLAPAKAGTDVVFLATAHAARPVPHLDVTLAAGTLQRVVRVFGDRSWQRGVGGYRPGAPQPFVSMPLVWERAFGGVDPGAEGARAAFDERNPVGVGFAAAGARGLEGHPVPNLEDPYQPLQAPGERPAPAGVGFVGRGWPVRARLAGTLDAAYRRARAPLLPLDFDPRYFHGAPAGWTAAQPFRGGERLLLTAAFPGGVAFDALLPALRLGATATIRGERRGQPLALDTILVNADHARVELTYRTLFRVPKSLLSLDRVRLEEVHG
jgi:hypothetical protein